MAAPSADRGAAPGASEHELTPEEEAAWEAGLERVAEEKRRALEHPGPTWREWFFYDHARWWVGLLFLIVDSWIATAFLHSGTISGVGAAEDAASLAAAIYLEFLLYRYLWRRPTERSFGRFRPSWTALTEFGRWTPEGERVRRGEGPPVPEDGGPSPREFL